MSVTVYVRPKNQLNPHSSSLEYHDYVAEHGARPSDFLTIRDFARAYSLEAKNESPLKRSIELHGKVIDLCRAFGVRLERVWINGRIYRHCAGTLAIPVAVAPIIESVGGFDDHPQAGVDSSLVRTRHIEANVAQSGRAPRRVTSKAGPLRPAVVANVHPVASNNIVPYTSVAGLAAMFGMVTAAGVVATLAISEE
jgi:hypothetical protein